MENIISRHRNLTVLAAVLFAQVLGLAMQVKRPTDSGSTRLIRVWAVYAITPLGKVVVGTSRWAGDLWRNYVYLRGVRQQNQELQDEITRMRLDEIRIAQDASQARRLQALLQFKEQFISETMAAQVISTTGSEFSRGIYIDKGSRDGIKPDMPVITPQGIVGKVLRTYAHSSLVLEINDPSSGAGIIMEKSRLQGILKGDSNRAGETVVNNIMADEKIAPGEQVITSGGDRVYPKGLTVGTVLDARPTGDGTFLRIRVKPAASLDRVEEVLVITKVEDRTPAVEANEPVRAIDILAQRLPSVPVKPPDAPGTPAAGAVAQPGQTGTGGANPAAPPAADATGKKPSPPPAAVTTEKPKVPNLQPKDNPR